MRKLYSFIFVCLWLGTAMAQHVQFFEPRVDCGVVKWKKPVTATFTLTNSGTRTLTISQVRPDCSCTAVDWTRTPIPPGGRAQVHVTYDAELLGTFEKQVAVYTNLTSKPTYATMRGRVVLQPETFAETVTSQPHHDTNDFNYTIGDIHLTDDNVEFDDVQLGDSPTVTIRVLNAGNAPYSPALMHLPIWLQAETHPHTIRPGHTGDITFRLRSDYVGDFGLTQSNIYLSRFPGDIVGKHNELTVSATILPRVYSGTVGVVPVLSCDTVIDLGAFNGKEQLKSTITIRNEGQATLEINKLQVYNLGIFASLSSTKIRSKGKAKLTITAVPGIFEHHGRHRILLITNDPRKPKLQIEVRASK